MEEGMVVTAMDPCVSISLDVLCFWRDGSVKLKRLHEVIVWHLNGQRGVIDVTCQTEGLWRSHSSYEHMKLWLHDTCPNGVFTTVRVHYSIFSIGTPDHLPLLALSSPDALALDGSFLDVSGMTPLSDYRQAPVKP